MESDDLSLFPPCCRPFLDFGAVAVWVRRVAEAEEGLEAAPQAALVHALPALPVLLLGFVGQEVNEIVSGAQGKLEVAWLRGDTQKRGRRWGVR